jgi:hypothetical protein
MSKKRNKEELPWVDIILTAEELRTLYGKGYELLTLYIGLSQRRDFKTGVVGQRTHLSDQALKEIMHKDKTQGKSSVKITTNHIRYWLKKLEDLGLVIQRPNYVFELPKAPRNESGQKKFHQNFTKSLTGSFTSPESDKSTVIIDSNDILKSEVSPEVSPEVSQYLHTPLKISEETNVMLLGDTGFSKFNNLLNEYGFRPEQILNAKTSAMVKAWMAEGITIAEAKEGIEAVNVKRTPNHPSYYLHAVLSVRRAKLETEREIKDERLSKTRRVRQHYPDDHTAAWETALAKRDPENI